MAMLAKGEYIATPPTLVDGQYENLQLDSSGNLKVNAVAMVANVDLDIEASDLGAAAEGAALGNGVLIQGDDGTDRTNVLVDTSGHVQVDEQNSTAIKTAVEIIDNCISGSEAQVDVVTVPAPLSVTGSGTEATAMRVTVATDSTGVLSVDDNGSSLTVDGSVTASAATSVGAETVQANAAVVAAAAWSTIDATATGGLRWAKYIVSCNKAHTVEFYGDSADFAAITTAHKIKAYTSSGNADNSATGGDTYYVPCAGHAFAGCRVQNNDGAANATISVSVSFFD